MKHLRHRALLLGLALALAAAATAQDAAPPPTDWPDAPEGARLRAEGWFAPRAAAANAEPFTTVFVIPIKTDINPSLVDAVRRKISVCKGKGADLVIFELDTPGGRLDAMEDICAFITDDLADAHTVAFVNPDAFSAGAIISLACNEIVTTQASKIGAATPILISADGGLADVQEAERAKIESATRAIARALADPNGHSIVLAEAMITMGVEVWMIQDTTTGELQLVNPDKDNWRQAVTDVPNVEANPGASWRYLRSVDSDEDLVTLIGREAYDLGLADALVEDRAALLAHLKVEVEPTELTDTWSEKLAAFLTNPPIAGLLMMLGILGVYVEIRTPGFGAPGIMGIVCLALAFGSRYLTGLAEWWEIALIIVGVVLLILEVAVIPGFGVAGIAGLACLVVGLLAVIVPNAPGDIPIPRTPLDWSFFTEGLMAMAIGFVLSIVGAAILTKYLPRLPLANKLILADAPVYDDITAPDHDAVRGVSVGDVGVVEAMCRPVGKARIGTALIDVVTEGEHIDAGTTVKVLQTTGNRIVVVAGENTEGVS